MDMLTIKDIAVVLDVQEKSARLYHENAQRHRRQGRPRPQDMPPPDALISGRYPRWKRATIEDWAANRRGRVYRRADS